MQAGRQAGGLAGRQPLTFEMLRCIVLDGPQSKLFSGENGVIVSECVWWRVAVLVYLREGLQALLQNTPGMPLRRQPKMFAMLQCIVLDDAAEHATLLESLAHQPKCGAVGYRTLDISARPSAQAPNLSKVPSETICITHGRCHRKPWRRYRARSRTTTCPCTPSITLHRGHSATPHSGACPCPTALFT